MCGAVDAPRLPAPGGARAALRRMARQLPAFGLAALVIVDAVLLVNGAQVVRAGGAAVTYPFELDFGEGLVLVPTRALASGDSLYPPAAGFPTRISNYTPVYYAASAALGSALGDALAAGRALSLASTVLAAIVLAALAWRAIDPDPGRVIRRLAAASAGLAFLQISYTASFAALMRVDALAVLFAFAGVLVFCITAAHGRRVYWCLVPLVLALYTKQSTVAAAAACVLTLARNTPRRGLALGAAFAAAAGLATSALQLASHGGFAFHVITANLHPYSWDQTASFLQDIAIHYPVLVALAVAGVPGLLASLPRRVPADSPSRPAVRSWTRAVLGAYLPLAALISLTVGKLGAEVNYLIELMGVIGVCAAIAVADALGAAAARPLARPSALAALAVPALLLWQVTWLSPPRTIELPELRSADQRAALSRLVELVRRADGPVLSEDLTLLSLADKPTVFEPFNMTQLMYAQVRDEAPFLAALDGGGFRLIVLGFDLRHPPPLAITRFSPAMLDRIAQRYTLLAAFPDHWVYRPR